MLDLVRIDLYYSNVVTFCTKKSGQMISDTASAGNNNVHNGWGSLVSYSILTNYGCEDSSVRARLARNKTADIAALWRGFVTPPTDAATSRSVFIISKNALKER
jgi:hypothetical protein